MQIHVARGNKALGIFSPAEVRSRLRTGEFKSSDLGWTEGRTEWAALSAFADLAPAAAASAPPPLPSVGVTPRTSQPPSSATSTRVPSQEYYPPGARAGRNTSGTAIASLVLGILGITILPILGSIPAVICGHIALSGINRNSRRVKGHGLATAGLIMGYLGVALLVVAFAVSAGPIFESVQQNAKLTKSLTQGKQIAVACRQYAAEHDGAFPAKLEDLVPTHLPDAKILTCPLDPAVAVGYQYYGGKDSDPPTDLLLVSKAAVSSRNKRIVIYVDSSGKVVLHMPELPRQKSGLHLEIP